MSNSIFLLLSFLCLFGLASCEHQKILFATSTQFAVEVGVDPDGSQSANVGYQRAEGATMPNKRSNGDLLPKAYPTISIFDMKIGSLNITGLGGVKVKQVFASGRAAAEPNAPQAAANTMLDLAGVPTVDTRPDSDIIKREEAASLLESASADPSKTDSALQIVNDVLGTEFSSTEDALDAIDFTATSAEVEEVLKKLGSLF